MLFDITNLFSHADFHYSGTGSQYLRQLQSYQISMH